MRWRYFTALLVAVAWLIWALVTPPPSALTPAAQRTLGVMAFSVTLWLTEVIHPAVVSLSALVLLSLTGATSLDSALATFGSTTVWLLLAMLVVSASVEYTGLHRRLAYKLVAVSGGSARGILLAVVGTCLALVPVVPNSGARVAMLTSLCAGIVEAMGLSPGSNMARAIFLAVSFVSVMGSAMVMTGASAMIYAAGLFETVLGYHWDYGRWFVTMAPGALLNSIMLSLLLLRLFPPELARFESAAHFAAGELQQLGVLTAPERRLIWTIVGMITLWATRSLHGLSTASVGMVGACVLLWPGVGVFDWSEASRRVNWTTFLLFGSSLSLATALKMNGAIEWLSTFLVSYTFGKHPLLLGTGLLVVFAVLRIGFTNMTSIVAATLPLVLTVGLSAGVNPMWFGLVGLIGTQLSFFLPTQSVTNITTYATGYYSARDLFRAGLVATTLVILTTLAMSWFYWPRIGVHPLP